MADQDTSLPIRTETNGDVVAQICDKTTTSQKMTVDANGRIEAKNYDKDGNGLTSQANGTQQALDVGINVAGVQVDPRAIRALTNADVVKADQGESNADITKAWTVKPTDGTNSQAYNAAGEALVKVNVELPAGTQNIGSIDAWLHDGNGVAIPKGQAVKADSIPVVLPSDQAIAVEIIEGIGEEIHSFKQASAIAKNASDTHTYTVTAAYLLELKKIALTASGKFKAEIKVGTVGSTVLKAVLFNSTATPNAEMALTPAIYLAAGQVVEVVMTNLDGLAQDLYSTIMGIERAV